MRVLFFSFILLIFTSSCAFHSGLMTGNATLNQPNFQYVALAKGTATTTHFLGIGGLKKDALMFEAKKDLLRRYPLRKGQALANVTVDMKRTFVILVMKTRATVTADVVDYNVPGTALSVDSKMVENYRPEINRNYDVSHGDSVYFINHGLIKKGVVDSVNGNNFRIKYTGSMGDTFFANCNKETTLLKASGSTPLEYRDFKTGEKVKVFQNREITEGIIFGMNSENVGLKYDFKEDGTFKWKIIPLGTIFKLE